MLRERLWRNLVKRPSLFRVLWERWWTALWNSYVSDVTVRFLDLGARGGLREAGPCAPLRYLKNVYAVGVEPDKEEAERLEHSGEYKRIFCEGVAGYTGEAFLYRSTVCPSIKRGSRELFNWCGFNEFRVGSERGVPVRVKTPDDLLGEDKHFDFIKIDIHGVEYEVLSSMSDAFFEHATCIFVEVPLFHRYEGEVLSDEIIHLMRTKGFFLLDFDIDPRLAWPVESNAVFVKFPQETEREVLMLCLSSLLLAHYSRICFTSALYFKRRFSEHLAFFNALYKTKLFYKYT